MTIGNRATNLGDFVNLGKQAVKLEPSIYLPNASLSLLPRITEKLLRDIFQQIQEFSLTDPKLSWAVSYIFAGTAKQQKIDKKLEASAAWILGWAANEWVRPQLAVQALTEAKRLFGQIGARDWIAACDWQANALPWTKPNFEKAKTDLEFALQELGATGMDDFYPRCQLTLAHANLLINKPETLKTAEQLIDAAQETFRSSGDLLWVAKSELLRANLLARRGKRLEGITKITELRTAFLEESALIDHAKASYQLAMNFSIIGESIERALSLFEEALDFFRSVDLPLWEAHCLGGLGIIRTRQGNFEAAELDLVRTRTILEQYQIQGMLADNLNDSGRLALVAGDYQLALERTQRAIKINERLGSTLQRAIGQTNLGRTYTKMGRFQSALVLLEETCRELEQLGNPGRLGDCRLYLALVWMQLGRYQESLKLLDAVEKDAPLELKALAFEASLAKVYCLIGSRRTEDAHQIIAREIEGSQKSQSKTDLLLLNQALGFLHFVENDPAAEVTLYESLAEFTNLGMVEEEAICLTVLGEIYNSRNQTDKALETWLNVLSLIRTGAPAIRIKCLAGVAGLYEKLGEVAKAVGYYRKVLETLSDLAPNFWQPSIYSWFVQSLSQNLDKALPFFHSNGYVAEATNVLESIKAHTFKQQLSNEMGGMSLHDLPRINQLRESINQIHQNLLPSYGPDWLANLAISQSQHAKILPLVEDLEKQYGLLERRGQRKSANFQSRFDINRFQNLANQRFGHDWAALDYYLTADQVFFLYVKPDVAELRVRKLTPRLMMALSAISLGPYQDEIGLESDLRLVSEYLLPSEISDNLEGKTLIISPHTSLWFLPWAGLPLISRSKHLMDAQSWTLTPSLESLLLLWEDSAQRKTHKGISGGFVGLSRFEDGETELPLVLDEFRSLQKIQAIQLSPLVNERATHQNTLRLLSDSSKEGNLDFLHLATHIHYDPRSSHLCYVQLQDKHVWSEDLFGSAPLPKLVFISACYGGNIFVYEGGEATGLALTCLSNGARVVVGSKHAISDHAALQFTRSFYRRMAVDGVSVGEAVAKTQQTLRDQGAQFSDWANFTCLGVPDWVF